MSNAPNSLRGRRQRWRQEAKEPGEPKAIILSVRLDNGSFETSISIPLTEAIDFDKHAARWLALAHTALQQGVSDMAATLPKTSEQPNPKATVEAPDVGRDSTTRD